MPHQRRHVAVLRAAEKLGRVEVNRRALAHEVGTQLGAREPGAEAEGECVVGRTRGDPCLDAREMERLRRLLLQAHVAQRGTLLEVHLEERRMEVGARAARDLDQREPRARPEPHAMARVEGGGPARRAAAVLDEQHAAVHARRHIEHRAVLGEERVQRRDRVIIRGGGHAGVVAEGTRLEGAWWLREAVLIAPVLEHQRGARQSDIGVAVIV